MEDRFIRIEQLIGAAALGHLRQARIAVFGLGAVGSYAVEALARAAVGFLRLVDCDVVRLSNFNRQLYATTPNLGRPKTEAARERVLAINPDCIVEAHQVFIDETNAAELLAGPLDAAIDAIDSLTPKVTLLAAAAAAGVPTISCMGAATRRRPELIRAGDISETRHCPLARFVRKKLRQRGIFSGITCIYSEEPAMKNPADTDLLEEGEHFARGRRRRSLGSLSYLTGMFGLWAAYQAIELICNKKT